MSTTENKALGRRLPDSAEQGTRHNPNTQAPFTKSQDAPVLLQSTHYVYTWLLWKL